MARHETASSKVLTIFQVCSRDVFLELEGIVKRIKRERGFSTARAVKGLISQKTGDSVAAIAKRFRIDGVDSGSTLPTGTGGTGPANHQKGVAVAPVKGGQPDATV